MAVLVTTGISSRAPRRRFPAVAAGALAAVIVAQPAAADELDTVNFKLTSTLRYDANQFKTADNVGPPAGYNSKADYVQSHQFGLNVNKAYGLQKFQLVATETKTMYRNFSYLDNEALEYKGTWQWALTPRLSGSLTVDRAQAQLPFTVVGGTQRNVRTTNTRDFSVDGWVTGGWHLVGGAGHTESKTELAVLSSPSSLSDRFEGGIRYDAVSGNSVTLKRRVTIAELVGRTLDPVNLIDTNYRDITTELTVAWKPNPISSAGGTLARQERRNDHFTQRDFAGYIGDVHYSWAPTGKLTFNLSARRNMAPYVAFGNTLQNATYRVDKILSLGSSWQADNKIGVTLNFTRTQSDFLGPIFAVTGPAQADEFRVARLGVSYAFARYLSLNASIEKDRRSSNVAQFNFEDTVTNVSASLSF